MNKKLFFSFSLFAILSISFLTSCENESSSMLDYKDTARRSAFVDPTMNNDTTVLCVNSLEDLQHSLSQIVNERDKQLRQKGWTKVLEEQPQTRGVLRAKRRIRTDTVYINQETVDYYSNPSVYANFNAKFSKSMVDSINKVVSPELRISTKKTYVCRWRLYGTYYDASDGEKVSARPSPLCGLVPNSKSSFTERGYSLYLLETKDNNNQYQMNSYQLRIQWENVRHKTIILDIDWPFFAKDPSNIRSLGYQFIYAVSKKI
ncbi:hypothetical protein [Hoylesella timonensis]|jgi:hypothetical protein|uniref:hypothetical protein n=1 Tax=Hoylesella timonensis TaxID=386414 RepID=UPI00242A9188|nr:hypothetical protein [Hoylesella timonensis]